MSYDSGYVLGGLPNDWISGVIQGILPGASSKRKAAFSKGHREKVRELKAAIKYFM